jgi:hypothetical protein
MNDLAIAVLSALLATGSPVAEKWRAAAALVEAEYQQLLEADDRALADVERWMREDRKFQAAGGGRWVLSGFMKTSCAATRVTSRAGSLSAAFSMK